MNQLLFDIDTVLFSVNQKILSSKPYQTYRKPFALIKPELRVGSLK